MSLDYEVYKEGGLLNDRYQKIEDISEGSYGYVSLAKDIQKKKLVAVKFIFKLEKEPTEEPIDEEQDAGDGVDGINSANSSVEKRVQLAKHRKSIISSNVKSRLSENICFEAAYEIEIQRMIGNEHRNIVKLIDFFDSYIILEYCSGGDLYEAIKGDLIPRKTKEITHILTQIIEAIQYVHSKGIFHRDIKPENILISNLFDWTIKLSDWGLATTHAKSLDRNVGSERYMAPELFESNLDLAERKEPYQCDKVDVWSIGIVFLNIVFSKNPFSVANQTDKSFCYFAANREALFDVFSTMSLDFFQVLRYSLTIDPANRDLKRMRLELDNLSGYTLDDEYYNSLQDDDIAVYYEEARQPPAYVPPSSAPAPVSLPTPPSSSRDKNGKRHGTALDSSVPKETDSVIVAGEGRSANKASPIALSTTNGNAGEKERAKSVPKFKFRKRSHVQKNTSPSQNQNQSHFANGKSIKNGNHNHNNGYSYFGNSYNYNQKNHYINGGNKPKIVKHSRKPLGIPTPNTYINNYFNDYQKNREQHGSASTNNHDFNTRDFFTPPSVNNRYMEGIFSHNNTNKHSNNNNYNNKHYHFPHLGTNGSKGKQPRRPSSGNRASISKVKNSGTSPTSVSVPAYNSPGKYIPPNVRNHHISHHQSDVPNISTVLDTPTYHEQYANSDLMNGKTENNNRGDLDDILFTLEESDDFLRDINNLSLHDPPVSSTVTHPNGSLQNDLPDLLKSPEPPRIQLNATDNPFGSQILNGGNHNKASERQKIVTPEHKYKQGIYVPPHHRKSFNSQNSANEATLSVGPNSYNYSTLLNSRRSSAGDGLLQSYQAPFMPSLKNHSTTTTALQDKDVFAQTDNDAILFSEDDIDDSDDDDDDSRGVKTMFGPYSIYNNGEISGNLRTGRKSSTLQDEAVGSLEQYKNNWLMLQQQQD